MAIMARWRCPPEVAVGEVLQVEFFDCTVNDTAAFGSRSALMVGIAAEHEQVAHGDAAHDAVFLGEDGQGFGEFGGGGAGKVFAAVGDAAAFKRAQPRHKGKQGGFARTVGADEGGNAAFGDVEADVVEDGACADAVADVADGNHGGCLSGVGLLLFGGGSDGI